MILVYQEWLCLPCMFGYLSIFDVDETSTPLDPVTSDLFHRLVAWLLFASKGVPPDLQVAIVFLCTRICKPTQQDYKKLAKVIQTWNVQYIFR